MHIQSRTRNYLPSGNLSWPWSYWKYCAFNSKRRFVLVFTSENLKQKSQKFWSWKVGVPATLQRSFPFHADHDSVEVQGQLSINLLENFKMPDLWRSSKYFIFLSCKLQDNTSLSQFSCDLHHFRSSFWNIFFSNFTRFLLFFFSLSFLGGSLRLLRSRVMPFPLLSTAAPSRHRWTRSLYLS